MTLKEQIKKTRELHPKETKDLSDDDIKAMIFKAKGIEVPKATTQQPTQPMVGGGQQTGGILGKIAGGARDLVGGFINRTATPAVGATMDLVSKSGVIPGLNLLQNKQGTAFSQAAGQQQKFQEGLMKKVGYNPESTAAKVGGFGGELFTGIAAGGLLPTAPGQALNVASKATKLRQLGTLGTRSLAETGVSNLAMGNQNVTENAGIGLGIDVALGGLGKVINAFRKGVGSADEVIKKAMYETIKPKTAAVAKDIKLSSQKQLAEQGLLKTAGKKVKDWADSFSDEFVNKFKTGEIKTLDGEQLKNQTLIKLDDIGGNIAKIVKDNADTKINTKKFIDAFEDDSIVNMLERKRTGGTKEFVESLADAFEAGTKIELPKKASLEEIIDMIKNYKFTVKEAKTFAEKAYKFIPETAFVKDSGAAGKFDTEIANSLIALARGANASIGETIPAAKQLFKEYGFYKTIEKPLLNNLARAQVSKGIGGQIRRIAGGYGGWLIGGLPGAVAITLVDEMAKNPVVKSKIARQLGRIGQTKVAKTIAPMIPQTTRLGTRMGLSNLTR